jgi:hypothetical protein
MENRSGRYTYDPDRNYLEKPLNINYKLLPESAAKNNDIQYVLMTIARVGNRERTFKELQPIYDHIKGNAKVYATIVHANLQARIHNCGITHPEGHTCVTPNQHLVCTKSIRTESRNNTIVAYIDDELLPFFHDDGNDIKYNGMKIPTKCQNTQVLSEKKRASFDKRKTIENKKRVIFHRVQDFSDDMLIPSSRSINRQRAITTESKDNTSNSETTHSSTVPSHPFSTLLDGEFGSYGFDELPPLQISDFDMGETTVNDQESNENENENERSIESNDDDEPFVDHDLFDEHNVLRWKKTQRQSPESPPRQDRQIFRSNNDRDNYAPILDFMEAVDEFFNQELLPPTDSATDSEMLPLFTDDIIDDHELNMMDVLDDSDRIHNQYDPNFRYDSLPGLAYHPCYPPPFHNYTFSQLNVPSHHNGLTSHCAPHPMINSHQQHYLEHHPSNPQLNMPFGNRLLATNPSSSNIPVSENFGFDENVFQTMFM